MSTSLAACSVLSAERGFFAPRNACLLRSRLRALLLSPDVVSCSGFADVWVVPIAWRFRSGEVAGNLLLAGD